ncbi:MAG: NAD(P)-dependent oxidoreductase [Bryobacteraceae bacterium]|nr:NAD(P)-dependent oxidoreductase [Bryobacteraceae bacterium]
MIASTSELEERLSRPSAADEEAAKDWRDGLLILGAGGKMGPTLALRARRAAPSSTPVIAVSRFTDRATRERLELAGIECVEADLIAPGSLERLPNAANVLYMAARKFGTSGDAGATWATNALLPGLVARRYAGSRIVSFSTGNVYPLMRVESGGPDESAPLEPVGEYGWSALARERLFEYASREYGTRVALLRLNYAVEMRYGVLADVAWRVWHREPVRLEMGYVNVIWQSDANSVALRAFAHCASPPFVVNVTGTEVLSVRWLAEEFGRRFGRAPLLAGSESETALLSNASRCRELFGPPEVSVTQAIDDVAAWVAAGGVRWEKPTHFEARDGKF